MYANIKKIFLFFTFRFGIEGICMSAVTVILWVMRKGIKALTLQFESKMEAIKSSQGRKEIMDVQMCLAFHKIQFLQLI